MKYTLTGLFAVAALAVGAAQANAQYPEHAISMVVSYAPGGGTDLVARAIAPYIQKYLGDDANIVVLNRPGAGGAIGFSEIKRAKPDGYTIGFVNTPNMLTIPIERKANYHWRGFDLLGNLIDDPDGFAVSDKGDIKTLKDLEKYAKEHPGQVTVGTTGVGSDDHLAMMKFEKLTGTKLNHVPFKGAGEVRNAIQSGQIMLAAMNVGEVLAYQKGGTDIRLLGTMSQERSALAPDVPTFREQGYDVIMASLRGIAAPKGLPDEIATKLRAAVQKASADPEFIAKAKTMFVPLRYMDSKTYHDELVQAESEFKDLWQASPWSEKTQ